MLKKILICSLIISCIAFVGCTTKENVQTSKTNNTNTSITKNDTNKNQTHNTNNNNTDNIKVEKKVNKNSKKQKSILNKKENFYGIWRINEFLNTSNVSTYSIDDLQKIIGSKITLSKKQASCFGDEIQSLDELIENPIYKKRIVSKEEFEKDNKKVDFKQLGITENSIEEVFVKGKNYNCHFYIKDNNTLILSGGGAYLKLIKIE